MKGADFLQPQKRSKFLVGTEKLWLQRVGAKSRQGSAAPGGSCWKLEAIEAPGDGGLVQCLQRQALGSEHLLFSATFMIVVIAGAGQSSGAQAPGQANHGCSPGCMIFC